MVLSLSWSTQSNIIASGGEDFRFKIWDFQGANLFISSPEDYAITSVAFNPEKDVLLVSTFNMLKLCSSAGVSVHFIIIVYLSVYFFLFLKVDLQYCSF